MSEREEPIPAASRHSGGQRVFEEAETHRCMPILGGGGGSVGGGKTMYIGVHVPSSAASGSRKKRRRRRNHQQNNMAAVNEADENATPDFSRLADIVTKTETGPQSQTADPSARVQFLLGSNQDDDENGPDEPEVHPVFCEMDELFKSDAAGDLQWKETARWIKFEEDVEEGGERWSKPHVATLSLFALFEVRNSIYNGEIMLECEGQTMESIADLLLDRLVQKRKLTSESRELVKDVLLKRHLHLHEKKARGNLGAKIRSFAEIGRKHSSKDLDRDAVHPSVGNLKHVDSSRGDIEAQQHGAEGPELTASASSYRFDQHFMKKIPPGAETSNILVGSTDFLDHPVTAFIRLKTAVVLGDLTEVPVPTRFIYVLLGPPGQSANFHEMGRSMATLMSDEVFHDVAYLAKSKDDLLCGVDEFLKSCTVLPPNEWDPSIRIEPPKEVPSQEPRKQGSVPVTGSNALLGTSASVPAALASHELASGSNGGEGGGSATASSGANLLSKSGPNGDSPPAYEETCHTDPSLRITGRLFGGLVEDVKRKAPFYWSDIRDAIHVQTIGAFFFLYFACLTPIITFGGLLSDETEGYLGAMESILSGAICGTLFALCSGQPLTILGSTGPMLVFESIIFRFSKNSLGWDYLSFRMWVGLWIFLILLTVVAFDLSALVKYITRFTEESFASLIALIFIIEAFKKLRNILKAYPINPDWHPNYLPDFNCICESNLNQSKPLAQGQHLRIPSYNDSDGRYYTNHTAIVYYDWDWDKNNKLCTAQLGQWVGSGCGKFAVPDVFFFSCLLAIGTFVISYGLKLMRTSPFFPNRVRMVISDFAVMIAIVAMTGLDLLVGLQTPKLHVPESFSPTLGYETRGWLVSPFGTRNQNPWYSIPLALLPALLATILIFMDQQITAVIVNRKENKLKKGLGYHLDLLIVAVLIGINSILGIPWFVAATVLSINHVMALKIESETTAPGERPKFLGCRENRVTGFLIFLLIGLSVFLTPVLKHIPMPVLYGVFLFMGISSLRGVQFVQRVGLFFMPQKYQPDYRFLRHVKIMQVHKFTIIQVTCLVLLWVVKAISAISILFPVMVLAMCFVRWALNHLFTTTELRWLDDIMPPITLCCGRGTDGSNPESNKNDATVDMPMSETPEGVAHSSAVKKKKSIEVTFNVSDEMDEKGAGDRGQMQRRPRKDDAAGSDRPEESNPLLLDAPRIVVQPPTAENSPVVEKN
ncbi:hypothetical protein BOX15_Mlig020841g1 [Macrostomum lignano]|uniref:Anion exchange protein n=1 Tax=Macrostomum lignano TaxID=282301 RepID=A0A267EPZ3_9PLAT|nr:hypothetical protein BOX15_Mlig020841g1 [Macrostomum lignano]